MEDQIEIRKEKRGRGSCQGLQTNDIHYPQVLVSTIVRLGGD